MDANKIKLLRPRLNTYLRQFDGCFGRREPVAHFKTYVTGQLSDLPRKSLEPMADAAGLEPRSLQQFLSLHAWDHFRVRDLLQQRVARQHPHPCSIGIIDESAHPKKGTETPGVQRQWCGRLGKVDNCVVTVHLAYAAGDFHCLVDSDLFLPQSWSADRERCREAGIPDDVVHRPKWQIALEQRDRAVANGVDLKWVTFDEYYPMNPEFLFALDDRGQHYIGEVKRTFTGWLAEPALLYKRHHAAKGPSGHFPRLKKQSAAPITVENMLKYSPHLRQIPWEKFHIKDTQKGPMVWEAKAVQIYLQRHGLPTAAHWLVLARNVENPGEVKFFIANAPADTPLEVLLYVGFARWRVERCFEDQKTELGMSHFEVRHYQSLRRHLIITAVTYLFLAEVQQDWRGEKSGADGLPGPHRQFRPGPFPLDVRTSATEISGKSGERDHGDATPQPCRATVACENQIAGVTQTWYQGV
jgi:SRSO17 transposase